MGITEQQKKAVCGPVRRVKKRWALNLSKAANSVGLLLILYSGFDLEFGSLSGIL